MDGLELLVELRYCDNLCTEGHEKAMSTHYVLKVSAMFLTIELGDHPCS